LKQRFLSAGLDWRPFGENIQQQKGADMKLSNKTKATLETILVIGLILIIPLFFAMKTAAEQNAATNTSVNIEPTIADAPVVTQENAPDDNKVIEPKQPPACAFPLDQTTTEQSTPENYTFFEPQMVLTPQANDSIVEIVQWLPDNQRVLLVQNFNDTTRQNIELFNPQTGHVQLYATRSQNFDPPAWMPGLNGVVYPDMNILNNDTGKEFNRQIWVSQGNPNSLQLVADNLAQFYVAVKPDGSQIAYQSEKQLSKLDASLKAQTPIIFDPAGWDYRRSNNSFALSFKTAWRPNTSQIFFYSYSAGSMGYTYLLDVDSGQLCELNFDGWAFLGRWSPNGRYLAIVRNQEPSFPANSTDLAVMDAVTGKIYTMGVTPEEMVGRHYVDDIVWAPDNHHLLTLGSVLSFPGCSPDCPKDTRLYLVDFETGQADPLISQFTANTSGTNLAWSPDGSKVIALCPKLCQFFVQTSGK
jgi:Tol biopolymer transport system component